MATRQYCDWYMPSGSHAFKSAEVAFQEACEIFEKEATNDPKKKCRLECIKATKLNDLIQTVNQARQHYTQDRSHSKIRRYLEHVTERIHHYGNIMDVLVQQHPEYVCLAWGTMKLLVGAVVEHKKMGSIITNSLLDIADALPRVKLVSVLYPTKSLQRMVAILYACIIKFLIRALRWYEEGSWKRALHVVTKPIGLQYDDILEEISHATSNIMAEATAGSQAEQRDMHNELIAIRNAVEVTSGVSSAEQRDQRQMLKELLGLISGLKIDINTGHVVAQTERSQIYRSVCDIKSTQALHVLSSQCLIDYEASLQASKSQRDRRRAFKSTPFWKSRDLQDWNQSPTSSFFILRVRIADRQSVQDFSTNVIQQLLQAGLASLWILKPRDETHSSIDALKSLIYQAAISVNKLRRENDQPLDVNRFLHAHSEKEHVQLLADVLCSLKVVYFIIQSSAIESDYIPHFVSCLRKVIQRVAEQGAATILRVLVIHWSPGRNFGETESLDDHRSRLQPLRVPKGKKARTPNRPFLTTEGHRPRLDRLRKPM
ncbi:uncharacterized protein N7503_004009 [Penicillium pulvis]|uniref:uncharacterized protein n=1 Tax=Penicillium pulvis TaxID=1562058 RepID=UPI002548601D|nr:uncharacterized protein N7503_004009 [Penicillium pulvis]KAJ5806407.1 hypothetical protein N7503_004009 [Penicillium pulvis]